MTKVKTEVSVVIPIYNERESLLKLYEEICEVLVGLKKTYEIILIDDGSGDGSLEVMKKIYKKARGRVRIIQFRKNFGKAAALRAGFDLAVGEYVIQLDADLQDDPAEIKKFLDKLDEGYEVVVGWKQNRKDGLIKRWSSRFFNMVTNWISEVKLHDHNCGFKAYRLEVVKNLSLYGELHRYVGVITASKGYRVAEVKVLHRRRVYGKTKYNATRFVHGFIDLLTVIFVTRYRFRPLHLFGYMGLVVLLVGVFLAIYLTGVKYIFHQSIGDRPLLLLSVMLMIMGGQIFITGLLGEQITTMIHKDSDEYSIRQIFE